MALSDRAIQIRSQVKTLLQSISSDLGNPAFIEREPTGKAYQPLPIVFVQITGGSVSLLTNKTRLQTVEIAVWYIYSAIDIGDRFDKSLKAAESIANQLWSDPSLNGLATGILGEIGWSEGAPIELGESEKFLHTIRVDVTYTLEPYSV